MGLFKTLSFIKRIRYYMTESTEVTKDHYVSTVLFSQTFQ